MIVHQSWQSIVDNALNSLDKEYLNFLQTNTDFFPDKHNFLNAFKTLSLQNTKAILFGQDPYPRLKSASGYAFIDGTVEQIFSKSGFSKSVNKATSLRNFLKMQLKAEGYLSGEITQEKIASLPKNMIINSIFELKDNFEKNGILLLNKALIFTDKNDSTKHIKCFKPFMIQLLQSIKQNNLELILFGNEAKNIEKILPINHNFTLFKAPHPYNVSFIDDKEVLKYFKQKTLLKRQTC